MSKNFCWGCADKNDGLPYVVVLMVSRNKDNHDIIDFKERRKARLRKLDKESIFKDFEHFVSDGVSGEMCRLYISLNTRDTKKIKLALLHELIDTEDFNFEGINGRIAGIAARKENALSKKWFFDFDSEDEVLLAAFKRAITEISATASPVSVKTPHGYAVVVEHGFDTRNLLAAFPSCITLKRDDLICWKWEIKE